MGVGNVQIRVLATPAACGRSKTICMRREDYLGRCGIADASITALGITKRSCPVTYLMGRRERI